jgi:hypothetical protein
VSKKFILKKCIKYKKSIHQGFFTIAQFYDKANEGDISLEGLCIIPDQDSPLVMPLLLVAH